MGGAGADSDQRVRSLTIRLSFVDDFARIRKMGKTDPEQMISKCEELLKREGIDSAVRIGDIYAQLIEHYAEVNAWQEAYGTVEDMRRQNIILTPYLDRALLEQIYAKVNQVPPDEPVPQEAAAGGVMPGPDDVGEEIE